MWRRLCIIGATILAVPLITKFMHAPELLKFIGKYELVDPTKYLERHVRFSTNYGLLYDFHKVTSALWFLLGPIQLYTYYCRDMIFHKWIGYSYFTVCLSSIISGTAMLAFRPQLAGGATTPYVLYFTFGYALFALCQAIKEARAKRIQSHKRWAIRNWSVATSSIINATAISCVALYLGRIDEKIFRTVMVGLGVCLIPIIEFSARKSPLRS
jgi:hypothetical protein